jgi:creatinine amidohydrolase
MVNWENTFHEIAQAKPEIALLPIGAIEQHSYHLPVATDYLAAQALGERVARELDIWLRPATLAAIVEDIVNACHHQGIHKVVLLVAHGGNWIIKPTVREINLDRKGVKVIMTNPDAFTVGAGEMPDIHSGRSETSLLLHLRPGLVQMDQVKPDFSPSQGREFLDYTGMAGVSPTGLWGAPSHANAEEGKTLLENAAKRAAEYIRTTFAEFDRLQPRGR